MGSNKKIILSIIILFLISAVYLSWSETRQVDSNLNKNWWSLSFKDPKSSDLSFVIENHSASSQFHWTVLTAAKTKLNEGDATIEKGGIEKVDLSQQEIKNTKRITISVSSGSDKKEIYKNFNK
jgi:hypothetical protein